MFLSLLQSIYLYFCSLRDISINESSWPIALPVKCNDYLIYQIN